MAEFTLIDLLRGSFSNPHRRLPHHPAVSTSSLEEPSCTSNSRCSTNHCQLRKIWLLKQRCRINWFLIKVHFLEKSFEEDNKLEPERKNQLAKNLGLQPRQVAVWFQNRRARWKTKHLERDYDHLKNSYQSLLSNYDFVAKENDKLKAELYRISWPYKNRKV